MKTSSAAAAVGAALPLLANGKAVVIDPTPKQTLTSFGASGAWWPNDLILFPEKQQKAMGDLLFSDDGLALTSYRYNVGGDGGNDDKIVYNNARRIQSFLLTNGTYDWTRDAAGVKFMQMANDYGVPYLTFFLNAAPSHIATNVASCGWTFEANETAAFAEYMQTVLTHWTEQGIDIASISPINEPDNSRDDCSQEGMLVPSSLRPGIFSSLRTNLDTSPAKDIAIIGDETSQIVTQAIPEYPIWLPSSVPNLAGLAVHNYDYPSDASVREYYALIQNLTDGQHPPVKYTETCCSTNSGSGSGVFGQQYDPTMTNALIVGRYVWQFLTLAQAESFDWWTAVSYLPCSPTVDGIQCATVVNNTAGYNDGLIYIDPNYNQTGDYNLYLTKRAFLLKHLTLHQPGSVRYDIPQDQFPVGVNAIASKTEGTEERRRFGHGGKQEKWSILFMNNQTTPYDFELELPGRGAKLESVVVTTNDEDWKVERPRSRGRHGKVEVVLPAESFVTLQFE